MNRVIRLVVLNILIASAILIAYRQGVLNERKRWQYCNYYDLRIEEGKK